MRLNIALPIIGGLIIVICVVVALAIINHNPVVPPIPPTPTPELSIPSELNVISGELTTIKAETKGKKVKWIVSGNKLQTIIHDLDLEFVPKIDPDGKVYKTWIVCATSVSDEPFIQICTVTVSPSGPTPPPGPVPPTPNPPTPPPGPISPLGVELQNLYNGDPDTAKVTNVKLLISVYRLTPALMDDKSILTAESMLAIIAQTAGETIPKTALPTVRERIALEIDTVMVTLTNPTEPMTDANRLALKKMFSTVYTALLTIK